MNKPSCCQTAVEGDEHTAETTLAQNWSKYSAGDKSQCIGTVQTGGPSIYVELLSCIEVLRDANSRSLTFFFGLFMVLRLFSAKRAF
jgi:hypothetical protein